MTSAERAYVKGHALMAMANGVPVERAVAEARASYTRRLIDETAIELELDRVAPEST